MPPAIEAEKLSRRFGAVRAVQALDLRVEPGAVYAFLGANGAGKTTTIRMLLGLIRPHAGAVRLFGELFRRGALARVGALVETPSLYPHLTGRENLEIVRRLAGLPARCTRACGRGWRSRPTGPPTPLRSSPRPLSRRAARTAPAS